MMLTQKEFSVQDVAAATGTQPRNISDWVSRGYILGNFEEGKHRRFSFSNVMEIALCVAAMQRFGFTPERAFRLAAIFAYIGEGGAGWIGEEDTTPERHPGAPFHYSEGFTFVVAQGDHSEVVLSKDGKIDMTGFPPDYLDTVGLLVLNVSAIFMNVCARLGQDHRLVLDGIYGEA